MPLNGATTNANLMRLNALTLVIGSTKVASAACRIESINDDRVVFLASVALGSLIVTKLARHVHKTATHAHVGLIEHQRTVVLHVVRIVLSISIVVVLPIVTTVDLGFL